MHKRKRRELCLANGELKSFFHRSLLQFVGELFKSFRLSEFNEFYIVEQLGGKELLKANNVLAEMFARITRLVDFIQLRLYLLNLRFNRDYQKRSPWDAGGST